MHWSQSAPAVSAPAPCFLLAARLPTPRSQAASTRLARAASALAAPRRFHLRFTARCCPIDSSPAAYAAIRGLRALLATVVHSRPWHGMPLTGGLRPGPPKLVQQRYIYMLGITSNLNFSSFYCDCHGSSASIPTIASQSSTCHYWAFFFFFFNIPFHRFFLARS